MAIRRPESFHHHEASLPGIKIHYVREGSGPPLLLMHGWPGFWWEWYKCIDGLAKHFDVILPDFRGYGDSEKPNLADISKFHLDLVTEDQANLLHQNSEGVCGWSRLFGAGDAQVRPQASGHDDQRADY
jgi:pimeloyl-ACP methyl ester carboxylesterase